MEERLVALLREADVAAAWVFGSRARGESTPASDLDIAVLRDARLPLLHESRLRADLASVAGVPVDLVDFRTAPLELRARIVLEGRVLFSDDEPQRVAQTVLTQSRWEDVRHSVDEMDRAYLARVAREGL